MDVKKILSETISSYDLYCDGFISSNNPNYITGILLDIGVVKLKYSHQGSILLDKILAFDNAEVASTNIGQINMITVSSFCGPSGLIWGYDIAKYQETEGKKSLIKYVTENNRKIPIYSAKPLKVAMLKLFGTVSDKRFPLLPGAHVPCAGKNITLKGPNHIYAALAFGIAKNRDKDACVFMEDVGTIDDATENCEEVKDKIINNMVGSVLAVGRNQKVGYEKIFVDIVDSCIEKDEIGCALVVAPYFKLAKKAVAGKNFKRMINMSLEDWEKACRSFFIDKK